MNDLAEFETSVVRVVVHPCSQGRYVTMWRILSCGADDLRFLLGSELFSRRHGVMQGFVRAL